MKANRQGRDDALDLLEEARASYLIRARKIARTLWAMRRHPVSVDDVRELLPPPAHIDPRVMGAIFNRGSWRPLGYRMVGPHAHARQIRTFVPKDYALVNTFGRYEVEERMVNMNDLLVDLPRKK